MHCSTIQHVPRVLVLLAAVCFGTTGTAQALGPDAAPLTVGATRIAVGGRSSCSSHAPSPPRRRRWPRRELGVIAAAVAVYQLAFFAAVDRTGVAVGTVVALGSAPALAGLAGRLLDGQPLTRRWAAATALACAGVLLLVLGGGDAVRRPARDHARRGRRLRLCRLRGPRQAPAAPRTRARARDGGVVRARRRCCSRPSYRRRPLLARTRRRACAGALPRRDPDRARLRAVRARAAPPDAGRDRDADARRAAHRHGPRDPRAGRAARRRRRGRRRARPRRAAGARRSRPAGERAARAGGGAPA